MVENNIKSTNNEFSKFLLPNLKVRKKGFFYLGLIIGCLCAIPFLFILLIQPELIALIILIVLLICLFVLISVAINRSKLIAISFYRDYIELKTIFSKKKINYSDIVAWIYTNERIAILKKRGTAISGYRAGYFSVEAMINNERRYFPYVYLLGSKSREESFILKTKENKYYCISVNKEQNKALESNLEREIGRKTIDLGGLLSKPLTPEEKSRAKTHAVIFPLTSIALIWIFYMFLFFGLSSLKEIPLHWGFTGVDRWGSIYELVLIPIILTAVNVMFLVISYRFRNLLYKERSWKLINAIPLFLTTGIIVLLFLLYLPYIRL
jgi:hypothetical protein